MSNQVYYSDFYTKVYPIGMRIPTLYDYYKDYESSRILDKNRDNQELIDKHKELGAYALDISNFIQQFKKFDVLPDRLWINSEKDEQPSDAEYIFRIKGGGIVMRENCANVFKKFKLGENTLTPLKIYELENGNLWRNEIFYFFNLCEQRHYLANLQSSDNLRFRPYPMSKFKEGSYANFGSVDNGDIELSYLALDSDIDIWHDPRLIGSIFISEPLYETLVQADIHRPWNTSICKII